MATPNLPHFPTLSPIPTKKDMNTSMQNVYSPLINSLAHKICSKLDVPTPVISSDGDMYIMHVKAPQYGLNIDIQYETLFPAGFSAFSLD